ncbi:MAG: NAD-glutamate dehydrogenase, partial [Proteobacteria bacterium]|nr:NAD-glutamate dehydrogenase [Pseudomonadota bacterium]
MTNDTEHSRQDLLAVLSEYIGGRLQTDEAPAVQAFVRQYYAQVAAEDLLERSVEDLYGAALSHWRFTQRYGTGPALLRVYNPRPEEQGWQSVHSVIEIVSEDMPFLVDSITMEVNRQGLTQHLIIHPIMRMRRNAAGRLECVDTADTADVADADAAASYVSIIHVEVDRRTAAEHVEALQAGLSRILGDVRAAVQDWPIMRQRLKEVLLEIEQSPPPGSPSDGAEQLAFLKWLSDDNFTLLGYREYQLAVENGADVLHVVAGTGVGILRETGTSHGDSFSTLPAEVKAIARQPQLLLLTKTNARSTVHRPGYIDYLGIRRFNAAGEVIGERRFLGLFTSTAYNANPAEIPLLRRKLAMVIERAGFLPKSHARKA